MTPPTTLRVGGACHANGHSHHPTGGGYGHVHTHADGHSHSHSHSHDHDHDAPEVVQWRPHTAPGPNPVLDIGGDIGALVVYLPELTASGELEAHPTGMPTARFHTGVHNRLFGASGDGTAWVAIFPGVVEGSYDLLDDGGATIAQVAVTGGEVRELDLR